MNISFSTKKLEKQMNTSAEMVQAYGSNSAKRLRVIMASLRAAPSLAVFAPPMSPPHRCHELTGNFQGLLSLDLAHPFRLLFRPQNGAWPLRAQGGLNWAEVTAVEIVRVEDTHG
jgi:plasmid maintenance system killer protein